MKILIIDDNKQLRDALGTMIETMGGQVVKAAAAEEGMQRLRQEHYDFVLLDLKMPVKDGMWFIKHAHIPSGTKVIAMSGFIPGMLLQEMYRHGVCGFLEKPFDSDELLRTFEACSGSRRTAREAGHREIGRMKGGRHVDRRHNTESDPFGSQRIYSAIFNAVVQGSKN